MKRRKFIEKTIVAGLGSSMLTPGIFASSINHLKNKDLVITKNASAEKLFDLGIKQIGGISRFVKPNQKVVINPNIGWDASPEQASNTNPKLVGQIVKRCIEAGAKEVYVFDYTCDNWRKCYKNSMIEKYTIENGGKIAPAYSIDYFQEVKIETGNKLKSVKEHELILESDVFINVPVLKHHSSVQLSAAMKNMMGIIWDRNYWHKNGLNSCIVEYASYRKPDLNIVDAYNILKNNGPIGKSLNDVINFKTQIISTDIVTADIASAKLFGIDSKRIPYIKR